MSSWIFNIAVVGSLAYLYAADGDLDRFKEKVSQDAKQVVEQVQKWRQEHPPAQSAQSAQSAQLVREEEIVVSAEVEAVRQEILGPESAIDAMPPIEPYPPAASNPYEIVEQETNLAGLMSSSERRQALQRLAEDMEMRYLQRGAF